jgi:hypothetical protein
VVVPFVSQFLLRSEVSMFSDWFRVCIQGRAPEAGYFPRETSVCCKHGLPRVEKAKDFLTSKFKLFNDSLSNLKHAGMLPVCFFLQS